MAIDLHALRSELTNDPKAIGYTTMDAATAEATINAPGGSGEALPSERVPVALLAALVRVSDLAPLSADQRFYLQAVLAFPDLPLNAPNTAVLGELRAIFPAGTAVRTALEASLIRPASRAEILFGAGVSVDIYAILAARALE